MQIFVFVLSDPGLQQRLLTSLLSSNYFIMAVVSFFRHPDHNNCLQRGASDLA